RDKKSIFHTAAPRRVHSYTKDLRARRSHYSNPKSLACSNQERADSIGQGRQCIHLTSTARVLRTATNNPNNWFQNAHRATEFSIQRAVELAPRISRKRSVLE